MRLTLLHILMPTISGSEKENQPSRKGTRKSNAGLYKAQVGNKFPPSGLQKLPKYGTYVCEETSA